MNGEAATVTDEQEPRRCLGRNADGTPCGVGPALVLDSGYCFSHDATRRSEHKAGAALGGLTSAIRRRKGIDVGALETAADAKRICGRLVVAIAAGELPAPQGRAALAALETWLRAHEQDELERRLAEQERELARLRGGH